MENNIQLQQPSMRKGRYMVVEAPVFEVIE